MFASHCSPIGIVFLFRKKPPNTTKINTASVPITFETAFDLDSCPTRMLMLLEAMFVNINTIVKRKMLKLLVSFKLIIQ